jgi:hypothetical protein
LGGTDGWNAEPCSARSSNFFPNWPGNARRSGFAELPENKNLRRQFLARTEWSWRAEISAVS